jgi:Bacterial inner membrane protein
MIVSGFILSQICAFIALISDMCSFQVKQKHHILIFFIVSMFFVILQYFFLTLYTAAGLMCIGLVRHCVAYFSSWKGWLVVFSLLYTLAAWYFFDDMKDIWIYLAGMIITFAVFQKQDKYLRIGMFFGTLCVIIYNILVFSPIGILMESVFLVSNMVWYYRFYLSKKAVCI